MKDFSKQAASLKGNGKQQINCICLFEDDRDEENEYGINRLEIQRN